MYTLSTHFLFFPLHRALFSQLLLICKTCKYQLVVSENFKKSTCKLRVSNIWRRACLPSAKKNIWQTTTLSSAFIFSSLFRVALGKDVVCRVLHKNTRQTLSHSANYHFPVVFLAHIYQFLCVSKFSLLTLTDD